MVQKNKILWLALFFFLFASKTAVQAQIWSNEIHYTNTGVDEGERIELAGLAGTSLAGWSVVFYDGGNGSNAAPYATATLTGAISAANCTVNGQGIGLYVIDVVAATGFGFQGGAAFIDGWALVNGSTVVEFFSYGGTMTATSGIANGMTSVDIGVIEPSTAAIGSSVQRTGTTTWVFADATNTFNICNTVQYNPNAPQPPASNAGANQEISVSNTATLAAVANNGTGTWSVFSGPSTSSTQFSNTAAANAVFTPAGGSGTYVLRWTVSNGSTSATDDVNIIVYPLPPPANQQLWSNEIHYQNIGVEINERIELAGPAGTSLTNWRIQFYDGNDGRVYATANLSGTLPNTCTVGGQNIGIVVVDVVAATGFNFSNGTVPGDGWALVYGATPIEFLSYGGSFVATNGFANGMTSVDINATEPITTAATSSIQRTGTVSWVFAEGTNTFGACNSSQYNPSGPQPPVANAGPNREISITGTATMAAIATNGTGTWSVLSGPSTSNTQFSSVTAANAVFTPTGGAGTYTLRWTVAASGFPAVTDDAIVTVYPLPPSICNQIFSNEIHYHNIGVDINEKIEVAGPAGTDLTNWKIQIYEGTTGAVFATANLSGTLPNTCTINGVNMGIAVVDIAAATGASLGSGPDGWALIFGATPVEFFSYGGTFIATNGFASGMTSVNIGATEPSTTATTSSIQRSSASTWVFAEGSNTFAACNTNQYFSAIPSCSVTGPVSVCANSIGNVYMAAAGMTSYSWSVSGGTIVGSSTGSSITVTAGAAGTYTVSVTVTNANNCTNTCSQIVTVNPIPACNITGPATVCPDATRTFNAPAGSSSYSWSISGNGTISGAANAASVSVIASSSGTYMLSVTVTNAGCTSTCSRMVNISPLPEATINGGGTYCGGTSVSLSAPAGGTTYAWGKYDNIAANPGYPQIGTGNPFSVTKSGVYAVTVTNAAGCTAISTTNVMIADYVINGSLGPGDTQKSDRLLRIGVSGSTCAVPKSCPGATGVGEVHYYDVHNFTNTQNVPVCVTIALNSPCGTNIFMAAFSAPFNPNNSCANYLGDPATSFFPNVTGTMEVTVAANGTLSVLVEVVPNGGTCSDYTIAVDILAAFPGLTVTAPNTACQSTAFNLSATAFTNAAYSWAGSGVTASTTNTTTATPTASSSQTYTVTVSTTSGCKTATASKVVSVGALPSCPSGFGPPMNGQTGVSFLDSLRWTPVPNITGYLVYFGNNAPNYDNILNGVNNGTGNTRGMSLTLTPNTTYGYRIVPVNACGQAVGCPTITFTACLPSFTCPANRNVNLNAASCAMVIPDLVTGLTANPGCGSLTFTQNPTAGTVVGSSHNGTVSVVITPNNPNVAPCTVILTGKDVTPAIITCPAFATINLNASCQAALPLYVPTSGFDNCSSGGSYFQTPSQGTVISGHNTVQLITLTVNDGNGNTSTCTLNVTLKDVTAPNLVCPGNQFVNVGANCTAVMPNYAGSLTFLDNCSTTTNTQSLAAGTQLALGSTTTLTLTTSDAAGNTASCTFNVVVRDVTPPTITCPPNVTVAANASCQNTIGAYSAATLSDNCNPSPAVTQSPASSTVLTGHNAAQTVTLTANDGNGNTTTCSLTVTLKDVVAPTVVCKPFTANLSAAGTASITTANVFQSGSDNCGIVNQVSVLPSSFTCANLGANIVILTVNDGNGNTSTCAATVTVVDNIPPTVACKNFTTNLSPVGAASITTANIFQSGSDNCGTVNQVGVTPSSFTCANLGTNTVTLTVNDGNGNTATCSASVTIVDNIPPTVVCKNFSANLNSTGTTSINTANVFQSGSDNCGNVTQVSVIPSSFTCANIGANTVELTVRDGSNNTTTCSATVTVVDAIAPTIICPANIVRATDLNQCNAVVNYTTPIASDNCAGAVASHFSGGVSGTMFQKGTTTVIWRATDGVGLTGSCSFSVTINDTQKPNITCPANQSRSTSLGLCSAVVTYPTPTGTDNCGLPNGEPVWISGGTNAAGSTATFQKGATVVIWKATDAAGNAQTCSFRVTVNDTEAPTLTCPAAISVNSAPNLCSGVATYTNPTFTDNCMPTTGTATRISGLVSGSNFPVGNSNVVFQATDASGNTRRCTMVVTVTDNQPPVINCPQAIVVTGSGTPCMSTVFYASATAIDNCAGTLTPFLLGGLASGSVFPAGVTTNTFKALTPNGQSANCSFTVTVNCGSGMSNGGLEDRDKDLETLQTMSHKTSLGLTIAPNPAIHSVTIVIEGVDANGGTLLVFDQIGRLVQQQVIAIDQRTTTLQVAEFAPGLYRIMLRTDDGMATKTLVVVKE